MRKVIPLAVLLLGTALAAAPVSAQVLVLGADFGGELTEQDQEAFTRALEAGAERAAPGNAMSVDASRDAIGDELVACRGGDCVVAIGLTISASLAVVAEIYAEAEIYDFTVRVFDLNDGETLVTQTGDCTFCPVAEAVDAFGFTAEAAIAAVDPMPSPSLGAEPAAEDPLEEPVVAEQTDGPALVPGDITFNISAVPEGARITVNGEAVGTGRVSLDLGAQDLTIGFVADGYDDYSEDVTLRENMTGPIFLRVVLSPEPQIVTVEADRPARPARQAGSGPDFNRRAVGGILLGTGAVMTAGGAVLLALDGDTTCSDGPPELCEEVWEFTAGGASLTTLGGLSMGTGIGLLISTIGGNADADETTREPSTHFSVAPVRRGGAVFVERRF